MPSKQKQPDKNETCCELRVETLLAQGLIPVDAVTDAFLGNNALSEVKLHANFDPIPLRLKLKKLGYKISREKSGKGWLLSIIRDAREDAIQQDRVQEDLMSENKTKFNFDGDLLTMDVLGLKYPNNFLEILRFMDRSFEDERLRIVIKSLTKKSRTILHERGWKVLEESKQHGCIVLLLETTLSV